MKRLDSGLHKAFVDSLKLSPYENAYAFFEQGFTLTDDDRFKHFDINYSPWIRTLCEWFEDASIDWIYLIFGSQTSKTTFMMGLLLYITQYVKGAVPILWVMSTEDEVKNFLKSRLKPFLNNVNTKKDKWMSETFRLFNSQFKAGYATNKTSLRSMPCRFVFGDECGIWKESVSYVKKRTRTFIGKRKGIFATTPPDNPNHHSWKEATISNFYQWWVECPSCGKYQAILFKNLKWQGRESAEEDWNYKKVMQTTRYQCPYCLDYWDEEDKMDIINTGKPVCVDPETYKQVRETELKQRTLQVSAMYSVFTSWGRLAVSFLSSKRAGIESLRIFTTDELAETIKEDGVSIPVHRLRKYETDRERGFKLGYDIYTAGVDVQRKGELFWVLLGWKRGVIATAHVLDYGITHWKNVHNQADWEGLLDTFRPFVTKLYRCSIDASDGLVTDEIQDFCTWAGKPFIPLRDKGSTYSKKIEFKDAHAPIDGNRKYRIAGKIMYINSGMIKDEIATALNRHPDGKGVWSFPSGTEQRFYQHLGNEIRINYRGKNKWIPKYSNAPQHWFSALVYAVASKEDIQGWLIKQEEEQRTWVKPKTIYKRKVRNKGGYNIWQ